jgi:putative ABC transport system permease protein
MERTREIGALRSLGLKKRGVSLLFALEGGLLGIMGSVLGIFITVFIWGLILFWEPTYIPPGISSPVPLLVNLLPIPMLRFSCIMIFLSLLASIIPARRAARQKVVEALGHV